MSLPRGDDVDRVVSTFPNICSNLQQCGRSEICIRISHHPRLNNTQTMIAAAVCHLALLLLQDAGATVDRQGSTFIIC